MSFFMPHLRRYIPPKAICFPSDPWCPTYEPPDYSDYDYGNDNDDIDNDDADFNNNDNNNNNDDNDDDSSVSASCPNTASA